MDESDYSKSASQSGLKTRTQIGSFDPRKAILPHEALERVALSLYSDWSAVKGDQDFLLRLENEGILDEYLVPKNHVGPWTDEERQRARNERASRTLRAASSRLAFLQAQLDVKLELVRFLREGRVRGFIHLDSHRLLWLPPSFWRNSTDAMAALVGGCAGVVVPSPSSNSMYLAGPLYVDGVSLEGALTTEVKPRNLTEGGIRKISRARAREWYLEWVAQHAVKQTVPSRDDDFLAAQTALGPGISRSIVRQLRRELSPNRWHRRGRPPKAVKQ